MTKMSVCHPDKIIVFLGPSLPVAEARSILPQAMYLPPAQCTDVLLAVRLHPAVIVIIDGVFERVAAVWHKEVLAALARGITVIGGGSMGALRAAELAEFGMLGVGISFREFRDGLLTDDDEVAVLHTADGRALTDAMVNIRDTLALAVHTGVLDVATAGVIASSAKGLFYPERTLEYSAQCSVAHGASADTVERFLAWSCQGGYHDRKRQDAIATLRCAASMVQAGSRPVPAAALPTTNFIHALMREVSCSPFSGFHDALPMDEAVALAARFLATAFDETRRLALFLGAAHDLATARGLANAGEEPIDPAFLPHGTLDDPRWQVEHDCQPETIRAFKRRMGHIAALERGLAAVDHPRSIDAFVRDLMRIDSGLRPYVSHRGVDTAVLRARDPQRYRRLRLTARLWRICETACAAAELEPCAVSLQKHADEFRQDRGLVTTDQALAWLRANELDVRRIADLLKADYRFNKLVGNHNLQALGVTPACDSVWWLRDALWLSGLYAEARTLLYTPPQALAARVELPQDDKTAFQRGFRAGAAGVRREFTRLKQLASRLQADPPGGPCAQTVP